MVEHAPHAPQLGRGLLLAEGVLLERRREPLLHRIEDLVPERRRPRLAGRRHGFERIGPVRLDLVAELEPVADAARERGPTYRGVAEHPFVELRWHPDA